MTIEQCIIKLQEVDVELEKKVEPLSDIDWDDKEKIHLYNEAMDSIWGAIISLKKIKI